MKQYETNQKNEIVSYRCKRCEHRFDSNENSDENPVYCSACFCEDVETVDSSSQSAIKRDFHSQKSKKNEKAVSFPTNTKLKVKTEETNIPIAVDCLQDKECGGKPINKVPEIRVWCHPHVIGKSGDDYYHVFDNFEKAIDFIKNHKEAEETPLIAFRGKEINIFDTKEDLQNANCYNIR